MPRDCQRRDVGQHSIEPSNSESRVTCLPPKRYSQCRLTFLKICLMPRPDMHAENACKQREVYSHFYSCCQAVGVGHEAVVGYSTEPLREKRKD